MVAAVEAGFRLMEFVHAPYYALFVVGPTAVLIELALARRAVRLAPTPAPPRQPASSLVPALTESTNRGRP